jgi:hypothetical protein
VAEDCGFGVAFVGIDEHARDDAVAVEGLPVCEMSVGLAGVRGGIVPMLLLDSRWRLRRGRAYHPPIVKALLAKSSRSPGSVLNGGSSPVLSFQKSSL